jgi:predicted nuclease with TOPRIM domain
MVSELVKENNVLRNKLPANEQNVSQNQNKLSQDERQRLLLQISQLQERVSELQAKNETLQKELKGKFGSSEYIDIRK